VHPEPENVRWNLKMDQIDSTELLIESVHAARCQRQIVLDPQYLNDENLPEAERRAILSQIFNRNIREKQVQATASHLAPLLSKVHPQSALIYGPTGSGKTVTLIHTLSAFKKVAQGHGVSFRYVYVDLTHPKTLFGAFNEVAIALDGSTKRYRKGIPIDYMQQCIIDSIGDYDGFLCLLIDEVDNIKPNPDDFLIYLSKTLPRRVNCQLMLIMLTNRLDWEKSLDPRIMSCLKKTDIIFEPYDALDLLAILQLRVEKSLDQNRVEEGALQKIAAYASKETGDARKAVELLAKAVRVAEESSGRLTEKEVDIAEERLEVDKTEEMIRSLASQQYLAFLACYLALDSGCRKTSTGETYDLYREICQREDTRPLTQRRFSDMISFLDLYGLVNARVVSKGRYGNTREISSSLPANIIARFLDGDRGN